MSEVRLPTGKAVLVLLGLCRQGPELEGTHRGDGRLWFRWEGLRGGCGDVGIEVDDSEALAALHRARSCTRSYVELLAILVWVVALAGVAGQWRLERVASLLYGPRRRSSHRERQLPSLHGWLALLERGWWQLDARPKPGSGRRTKRSKKGSDLEPDDAVIKGSLLSVQAVPGRSRARTIVPAPAFLAALAKGFSVTVPESIFRLPDPEHTNPEGNLPSLAIKARVRLAAAIGARWRMASNHSLYTEELLNDFAGLDTARIERRGHLRGWIFALIDTLRGAHEDGCSGVAAEPEPTTPLLRTRLSLLVIRRASGNETQAPAKTVGGRARAPT